MKKDQRFPLLRQEQCNGLLNSDDDSLAEDYFMKPIFKPLPDTDGLSDEEKAKYKFRDIEEGWYLVGLEIISNMWVNKGFCGMLLETYGLVLDESYPMVKKDRHRDESFVYLKFEHIVFSVHSINVSYKTTE